MKGPEDHKMAPPSVTLVKSSAKDVPEYLEEIGTCESEETVDVMAQVAGRLVGIHFKDGQEVKKGDLLFSIDPEPFEARLASAVAAKAEAQAGLDLAEVQLKRIRTLDASKVTNPSELDQAIAAEAQGVAKIQSADAAIKLAQIDLQYTKIYSPITGRMGQRQIDVGNLVKAFDKPMVRIERITPIYVKFTTVEQNLSRVREAMKAETLTTEVSVPNQPETRHKGNLTFLDSAVQPQSGRIMLRADLGNEDRVFWPGQFVNVRLILRTKPKAVLVPYQCVQISQQGEFVYVTHQEQRDQEDPKTHEKKKVDVTVAEQRMVQVGQRQGEEVVINSGLKAGEDVILLGQMMVTPGGVVEVKTPETAPAETTTKPATPSTIPATTRSGGAE